MAFLIFWINKPAPDNDTSHDPCPISGVITNTIQQKYYFSNNGLGIINYFVIILRSLARLMHYRQEKVYIAYARVNYLVT